MQFSAEILREISDAGIAYNFDTIDIDGKPEVSFKCVKTIVGREDLNLRPPGWAPESLATALDVNAFNSKQMTRPSGPFSSTVDGIETASSNS